MSYTFQKIPTKKSIYFLVAQFPVKDGDILEREVDQAGSDGEVGLVAVLSLPKLSDGRLGVFSCHHTINMHHHTFTT